RDVVRAVLAHAGERSRPRHRDNQIVVAIREICQVRDDSGADDRLFDAEVEALAALRLQIRIVGECDVERVRRLDAGADATADLRPALLVWRPYEPGNRELRIGGPHDVVVEIRPRKPVRDDGRALDVLEAHASRDEYAAAEVRSRLDEQTGDETVDWNLVVA